MKCRAIILLSLLLPGTAAAQLSVKAALPHNHVLLLEPIGIDVEIENNMAQPLVLGGEKANAVIGFDIERSPGARVPSTDQPLLEEPLVVPPQEKVTRRFNLLPCYQVRSDGPYTVRARVEWRNKAFLSSKLFLDVHPGLEIERLVAGVPGLGDTMHTYSLRMLHRERGSYVFLRIEDEEAGRCYGVIGLGRIVRLFKPRLRVDAEGNIHVLHQAGPRQFTHSAFTPYGYSLEQQQFTGEGAPMGFERDGEGGVSVVGGNAYDPSVSEGVEGEVVEFDEIMP